LAHRGSTGPHASCERAKREVWRKRKGRKKAALIKRLNEWGSVRKRQITGGDALELFRNTTEKKREKTRYGMTIPRKRRSTTTNKLGSKRNRARNNGAGSGRSMGPVGG